jgi:hypothetical protein
MSNPLMNTLDADHRRAVENIREAVGRMWARPLHRYYTDHTIAHSERIIALMDGLTAGMMATDKRLMPTEILVLLSAAYLHDIGMQNEKFANADLDEIREHHHKQSAEMIYAVFEDPANAFAIPLARDPGLVEAIAQVSKGHRKVDLGAAEYEPLVHGSETLRLRLLAALLRFGDELDIDYRRVDLEVMRLMTIPVESQLHWWKCHYVSGVSIVDEYIKIAYRLPQDRPDYEGLVKPLVENEVRARLASLEEIFRANAVKVAIGPSQVRLLRLVQPMPPAVERLAKKSTEGKTDNKTKGQGDGPASGKSGGTQKARTARGKKQTAGGRRQKKAPATPTTVFDQREQQVGQQTNIAGNYVDQRLAGGPTYNIHIENASGLAIGDRARVETTAGRTPGEPLPAPDKWNTSVIRDLLSAAFSDEEITTLCFDHFRTVYEDFASGMSKGQKNQRLLDYCERQDQIEKLLAQVQKRNPNQYARFEPQLRK